jgi:hypothetical protein
MASSDSYYNFGNAYYLFSFADPPSLKVQQGSQDQALKQNCLYKCAGGNILRIDVDFSRQNSLSGGFVSQKLVDGCKCSGIGGYSFKGIQSSSLDSLISLNLTSEVDGSRFVNSFPPALAFGGDTGFLVFDHIQRVIA